ncbi:MAG: cytochrome P450 [Clostridia bacterium]|nr:cytochrome P450 [Clostridia bacterium]
MAVVEDLFTPELIQNPHPYFHRLREQDPVHWNETWRGWMLTKYDDVALALRDHHRFSVDKIRPFFQHLDDDRQQRYGPLFDFLAKWIVFHDPPDHTRMRLVVNKFFTPKSVQVYRDVITATSRWLLDQMEQHGWATVDVIREYAYPLPIILIAEVLGVPPEDRDRIKHWSDEMMLVVGGALTRAERHERAQRAALEMQDYLAQKLSERRRQPRQDIISALLPSVDEGSLSAEELLANLVFFLFAGHETTTSLIGNGILCLAQHPEELARIQAHPELMGSAVEEVLRYEGPVKALVRRAATDFVLRGKTIRAGDRVLTLLAAANRDPERFPDPDRFDVGRDPNPHLGFGHGVHHCLGAPLARLAGKIAIDAFFRRFPHVELATDAVEWHGTLLTRNLKSLPVTVAGG